MNNIDNKQPIVAKPILSGFHNKGNIPNETTGVLEEKTPLLCFSGADQVFELLRKKGICSETGIVKSSYNTGTWGIAGEEFEKLFNFLKAHLLSQWAIISEGVTSEKEHSIIDYLYLLLDEKPFEKWSILKSDAINDPEILSELAFKFFCLTKDELKPILRTAASSTQETIIGIKVKKESNDAQRSPIELDTTQGKIKFLFYTDDAPPLSSQFSEIEVVLKNNTLILTSSPFSIEQSIVNHLTHNAVIPKGKSQITLFEVLSEMTLNGYRVLKPGAMEDLLKATWESKQTLNLKKQAKDNPQKALVFFVNYCQCLHSHFNVKDEEIAALIEHIAKEEIFRVDVSKNDLVAWMKRALIDQKIPFSRFSASLQPLLYLFFPRTLQNHNGGYAFTFPIESDGEKYYVYLPFDDKQTEWILDLDLYHLFLKRGGLSFHIPLPHFPKKGKDLALSWLESDKIELKHLGIVMLLGCPDIKFNEMIDLLLMHISPLFVKSDFRREGSMDHAILSHVLFCFEKALAAQHQKDPTLKSLEQSLKGLLEKKENLNLEAWIHQLLDSGDERYFRNGFLLYKTFSDKKSTSIIEKIVKRGIHDMIFPLLLSDVDCSNIRNVWDKNVPSDELMVTLLSLISFVKDPTMKQWICHRIIKRLPHILKFENKAIAGKVDDSHMSLVGLLETALQETKDHGLPLIQELKEKLSSENTPSMLFWVKKLLATGDENYSQMAIDYINTFPPNERRDAACKELWISHLHRLSKQEKWEEAGQLFLKLKTENLIDESLEELQELAGELALKDITVADKLLEGLINQKAEILKKHRFHSKLDLWFKKQLDNKVPLSVASLELLSQARKPNRDQIVGFLNLETTVLNNEKIIAWISLLEKLISSELESERNEELGNLILEFLLLNKEKLGQKTISHSLVSFCLDTIPKDKVRRLFDLQYLSHDILSKGLLELTKNANDLDDTIKQFMELGPKLCSKPKIIEQCLEQIINRILNESENIPVYFVALIQQTLLSIKDMKERNTLLLRIFDRYLSHLKYLDKLSDTLKLKNSLGSGFSCLHVCNLAGCFDNNKKGYNEYQDQLLLLAEMANKE